MGKQFSGIDCSVTRVRAMRRIGTPCLDCLSYVRLLSATLVYQQKEGAGERFMLIFYEFSSFTGEQNHKSDEE
jgi:hypothetical protein